VSDLAEAALRYAARGWPVFPCTPRAKMPCTPNGLKDATTSASQVAQWWAQQPEANVAIRTGQVSGLVVLDVDGDAGTEALRELERRHEPLPRTASVVTPRGGQHVYFAHPGSEIRNSAGTLGVGLDVRGDGGYVLAPPSVGSSGRRYEPDERSPLAPLPGWLLDRIRSANGPGKPTPASEWVALVRDGIADGQRNAQLTRLAGHLLRRYVDVDLTAELVALVNAHRCKPPLAAIELDRIIDSIAGRELRRRQGSGR